METIMHRRLRFSVLVIVVMLSVIFVSVTTDIEDVDAAGTGTKDDPYSSLSNSNLLLDDEVVYVYTGSVVDLEFPMVQKITITDPGLTWKNSGINAFITGSITVTGEITITVDRLFGNDSVYKLYGVEVEATISGPSRVAVNEYGTYELTITPTKFPHGHVRWTGSDTDIATVSYGVASPTGSMSCDVRGERPGTFTLYAIVLENEGSWIGNPEMFRVSFTVEIYQPTYTCNVVFNANGGSGGPNNLYYTGTSTSDHTFTIPSTEPTRSNYRFVEWNTNRNGYGTSYSPGDTISVGYQSTETLYAQWEAIEYTCYLFYNANGGSGEPSTQSYTSTSISNHTFTISDIIPTKDRYDFVEWNTNSSGTGTSYDPGSTISVGYKSTVTLYAIWKVMSFTVSFDSNGGTGIDPQVLEIDSKVVVPDDPELYGYVFAGWFIDDDTFLMEFDFNSPVQSDITLYAKWNEDLRFTTDPVADGMVTPMEGIPGTVYFKATTSKDYTSLVWDFGDGSTSTNTYATHFYSQPGTYTATLTVFNNHGSDTSEFIIEVPEMATGGGGNEILLYVATGILALFIGGLVIRRLV